MDLQSTKETVITLCQKAGEKLKAHASSGTYETHSKGGMDLVTEADLEIDSFLKHELERLYPHASILTEETSDHNFASYKEQEYVFIIDPIDGTTNFSRNDSHVAISIGLVQRGKTILGIVYLPLEEKLYVADAETDALCNDKKIAVSNRDDLSVASVGFDFAWEQNQRKKTVNVLSKVSTKIRQPRSLGCAAADICLVAEGKLDGYFIYGIKPWDHAAANLIVEKAGGKVTQIDGSEWNVFDSNILATNKSLHTSLIRLLT